MPRIKKSLLSIITLVCLIASQVGSAQERLKDFIPADFHVGGVLHGDSEGFKSSEYRNVAVTEFNAVTATIYMGWGPWPSPRKQPNVEPLTKVVDWANERKLKLHGHTLLYPMSNESLRWYQRLPNEQVEKHLEQFIKKAAGDHAGKVWVWDVVNEVMADYGQKRDSLGLRTKYKEYKAMGPGYVDFAFRTAKKADPDALLIINDYGIVDWNEKSTRLFKYVKKLKADGVPIDGVGFQSHCTDLKQTRLNSASIRRNFKRFAKEGFQLYITEMDVCSIATKRPHPGKPGISTPSEKQRKRQARFFGDLMKVALDEPACKALLLWDYADDFSWLHKSDRQMGDIPPGTYTHPTPFWCGKTCPIQRKESYYAMLDALKSTDRK